MIIKKIKILLGIFVLVFGLFSFAFRLELNNDLKDMELNGKVKSLRETTYEVVDKFGKIEKVKKVEDIEYFFDLKGNKVKELHYNHVGIVDFAVKYDFDIKTNKIKLETIIKNNVLYNKTTFNYDNFNNLIEEKEYNANGDIDFKTLYTYTDNKLVEKAKYKYNEESGKFEILERKTYIFNELGLVSQEIHTTFYLQESVDKTEFIYNKIGKLIETNYTNGSLNELNTESEYVYDEKQNLIELRINGNNNPWIEKYTYNNGNRIELIIEKYKESQIYEIIRKKYTLDNKGNWTKINSFKNDIPIYLRERNIQYYLNK